MAGDSIPRAVASGAATRGSSDDAIVAVRPLAVGIGAGALAALFLFVLYLVRPVPTGALALVGGASDSFGRYGGLRVTWVPPAGVDPMSIVARLDSDDTQVSFADGAVTLQIPRVSARDVDELARRLASGPLEFHEVVETPEMSKLASLLQLPMRSATPVDLEVDQWRPEDGGSTHRDSYLFGERAAIEAKLAEAGRLGWRLPAGTHIAYEPVTTSTAAYWRTYVVSDVVELDGSGIANAYGSYDPNTNRPIVLLDFTRAATARFGVVTERLTGHKLATIVGGEVRSAPVINQAIRGGRASITMGGSDPETQERERDLLVTTLRSGGLPAGGTLRSATYVPPADDGGRIWLARLLVTLGGGLAAGVAAFGLVRATRPVRVRAPAAVAGPIPWSRIGITLLAPLVLLVLSHIQLPGLDTQDSNLRGLPVHLGILGLTPIIAAYVLVELLAMMVPGWRRRRHAGPVARQPIDLAVIAVAVALVGIQGWFITTYLEALDALRFGMLPRLEVIGALGLATAALATVAQLIRTRGLGNGYTALVASGWLGLALRRWFDEPLLSGARVLDGVTLIAIALPIAVVLRWRVRGAGEAALRVPTTGTVALSDAGGLAAFAMLLGTLPFMEATARVTGWVTDLQNVAPLALGLVLGLSLVWSFAFARPGVVRPIAVRVGVAAPTTATWLRASALSGGLLVALATIAIAAPSAMWIAEPATLALVVATLLDAYADLRGHRVPLVRVWTVHQVQHADLAVQHLADAEISCHLSASRVRTLLAWFGPFAPVEVWVAPERAVAAHERLVALFVR